jgi:hypothetical protein
LANLYARQTCGFTQQHAGWNTHWLTGNIKGNRVLGHSNKDNVNL